MWYVQEPSSDFLKANQPHRTLFLLAQQNFLPPEIPIHTLWKLAQSTQTRGVGQSQGQGATGKGEVVKEARLGSSSPFASVCLFSEPRAEKGGEWGVWVWLLFSGFLQMMSGFLGMVNGTLLEASFQEGPCLEGWQGALGGWVGSGEGRVGLGN